MSVPFYSDESEPIHRKISSPDLVSNSLITVSITYEIDRCVEWINHNNFSKVALQFPDSLLKDAANVALELQTHTEKEFFILGDTSYGSCCVDEIAAEHVSADAIIHFGHACLSPSQRLPVLYIFGTIPIDVPHVTSSFREAFPDVTSHVIIYYEVFFNDAIGQIAENLKEYENLVVSELVLPNGECHVNRECSPILNDNHIKISKCQRYFFIPEAKKLEDYSIFYIGFQNRTITNIMLSLNECKFYLYNPIKKIIQHDELTFNKYIRKRYYYIEKTKDAKIIGILVGTLGVSDYLSIIKRLRKLIADAGKKSYTLVVGKTNVAKLANFLEIQVFVNVACTESSIIDCSGFFQPIINPYELEIALGARTWSSEYITGFTELLPDAAEHSVPKELECETDVSLVTGRIRYAMSSSVSEEETDESSSAVVQRDEMTLSIHQKAAGEFLSQRSWKGLEQCLGETPVSEIQQGKKGIASEYEDEREEQNR